MATKPRVFLSLLTEREEFQRMQAEAARAAAAREGLELEIAFAENNAVVQIQQVSRQANAPEGSRPAAIVVQAAATVGFEGAARAAVQAGIGWTLLSDRAQYVDALRREFPGRLVSCVYVDNEEVGRMQARIARALLPAGGSLLSMEGPSMSGAAQNRRRGLEQELLRSPVKIAKTLSADWTADGAERAVSSWMRHAPDGARPHLVVCQNDEMAAGVHAAVAAARPDWAGLPITGCDGLPERGQKLVKERVLTATIVIPPRAGIAVENVGKHLRKQLVQTFVPVPPVVLPKLHELAAAGERAAPARTAVR